jgi:signal transduction histidine kinase
MEPRLFQPFSGTSKADGSGLGLAIAKEIATAHGATSHLPGPALMAQNL